MVTRNLSSESGSRHLTKVWRLCVTLRRKALEFSCFLFVSLASKVALEPFQLPGQLSTSPLNPSFLTAPQTCPHLPPLENLPGFAPPLSDPGAVSGFPTVLLSWVGLSTPQALASSLWGFHTSAQSLCLCSPLQFWETLPLLGSALSLLEKEWNPRAVEEVLFSSCPAQEPAPGICILLLSGL